MSLLCPEGFLRYDLPIPKYHDDISPPRGRPSLSPRAHTHTHTHNIKLASYLFLLSFDVLHLFRPLDLVLDLRRHGLLDPPVELRVPVGLSRLYRLGQLTHDVNIDGKKNQPVKQSSRKTADDYL